MKEYSFIQKSWIITGVVCLAVILLLLLAKTFSVLLLILAASLIAIFFTALSGWVQKKTNWSSTLCLSLTSIGIFILVAGLFWLVGAKVQQQVNELADTIPATIDHVKSSLQSSSSGRRVLKYVNSPGALKNAKGVAKGFFRSTFGVLGDLYVVLFLAMFFTISPRLYTDGFVILIPKASQKKARMILNKTGTNLKKWLEGKFFAMLVVFFLTAIGLAIVGMPLWLILAIIAGLLNFIPNFGPIIAMIPALLVASMQGMDTVLIVAALYVFIQVVESNFITPNVQHKLIAIPPALIIIAQMIMGVLTGGWGLLLATPLVAILMVVVQETWLNHNKSAS